MRPPLVLPVAEYTPDLPDGGGSKDIRNVYPRTPLSYGPVLSPVAQLNGLDRRCQGGAAYRDSSGVVHLFASEAFNLYHISSGASWTNVSRSFSSYTTNDEEMWRFAYFNGTVLATNFADPIQAYILIGGTAFADLAGGPPRARHIAVVKNAFVVVGNTYDGTNGNMPQRVWWSAAGNHQNWPTPGTTDAAIYQSGAVDLLGEGGWVQGFAANLLNADAIVFQQHAVRRMQYTVNPVFSFLPVESAHGCLCPDSIVVAGGIAYYWGPDGIYAFDGAQSRPIGANKVDKTVYTEVDGGNLHRVVGTADPANKLIWWAYPTGGATDGNPDRLLCYNWNLDRFSICEVTCETLLRLISLGYTLDELTTILGYTSIETMPASLDSEAWQGGRLTLGSFTSQHQVAFFTGDPLAATVETQELQPAPGKRWLVTNSRPLIDGGGTAPTVAIGKRERKTDAVSYTPAVDMNALGQCPVRTSGRYMRGKIVVPANTTNTNSGWGQISGLELDAVPQGIR